MRPLLVVVAMISALAVAPGLALATPDHPNSPHHKTKPKTIAQVQKQLGQLALRNTELVEKYDQAQVAVARRDKAAKAAHVRAVAAARQYAVTRTEFVQIVQAQYEDQSFGAAGALLNSDSGANYVDRLDVLNLVSDHTAQLVKQVTHLRNVERSAAARAAEALAGARELRDGLGAKRKVVDKQIATYRSLLATLNSAQRAVYQRAVNPALSKTKVQHLTVAGTGAARRAVKFALAQVGKPYVYGAAGPGSYDCSGLTMASWAHAGVSLPHSAADQYNYGHHVSRDSLEPGDLLFFYQPIGHVTIYIGDGMMVSAPTSGEDVSVIPVSSFNSSYTGATRLT